MISTQAIRGIAAYEFNIGRRLELKSLGASLDQTAEIQETSWRLRLCSK